MRLASAAAMPFNAQPGKASEATGRGNASQREGVVATRVVTRHTSAAASCVMLGTTTRDRTWAQPVLVKASRLYRASMCQNVARKSDAWYTTSTKTRA